MRATRVAMQTMPASRTAPLAPAIAGLVLTLALAVGLSACGGGREASAPCAAGPAPILRIAAELPPRGEAAARASLSSGPFSDTSLIALDLSGRPRPALAQSWQASPDRRTWTFTLRDGLRAQNGQALTAARVRDLLSAGLAVKTFAKALGRDLQGIDAPTPTTLVIRLARPNSMLLEVLAGNRLASDAGHPDWYAGPFRLVRDTPDEMTYEPFAGVWSGPPTVAGLRLRFFPSSRAGWAAFLRDEADVFYDIPTDAIPLLRERRDVQLFDSGPRFIFTLGFQQRHPLLRDPRVRQALNLAIDREALGRRFFGTGTSALPGAGPFAPHYWAAEGAEAQWPYDPARARALLKAATAGRTEPIELVCLTMDQSALYADVVSAIELQLQLVRVHLRIVTLPFEEILRRMASGDFELAAMPMRAGYTSLSPYFFWRTPQQVYRTNYVSADAAWDRLREAASDDEERAGVRAVLDVMREDPPAVFVLGTPTLRAVRRTWRVPDTNADVLRTMPYWTLAETPPCGSR
jgi:ABC-type transport system substrate-binding protein